MGKKFVRLDAEALGKAGASSVLALHASAMGGVVALSTEEPDPGEKSSANPSIGVVRVEGPLAQRAAADLCAYVDGYDALSERFALALEAADGVLMVIDSPGGDVAGLEQAVGRMKRAKDASGKRVVAYVDEMAASAAYWIASAVADEIVVPASGRVGSIGCIGASVDMTAAAEAAGERWTVIREPAGKAESMPFAPIGALAEERLSATVKAAAGRFFGAVSKSRGLTTREIRGLNGAMFEGRAAVDAGLADRIGTLEQAAALAMSGKPKNESRNRAAEGDTMKLHAVVCAKLGLDADTSEADVAEVFAGQIDAMKAKLEAHSEKSARVEALEAEIAALKATAAEAEIDAIVAAAVEARKLTPAKRDEFAAKAKAHGAEWTRSLIDALPVVVGATPPPKPAETKAEHDLTPRQAAIAASLGIDPKDYAAQLAARTKKAG